MRESLSRSGCQDFRDKQSALSAKTTPCTKENWNEGYALNAVECNGASQSDGTGHSLARALSLQFSKGVTPDFLRVLLPMSVGSSSYEGIWMLFLAYMEPREERKSDMATRAVGIPSIINARIISLLCIGGTCSRAFYTDEVAAAMLSCQSERHPFGTL